MTPDLKQVLLIHVYIFPFEKSSLIGGRVTKIKFNTITAAMNMVKFITAVFLSIFFMLLPLFPLPGFQNKNSQFKKNRNDASKINQVPAVDQSP